MRLTQLGLLMRRSRIKNAGVPHSLYPREPAGELDQYANWPIRFLKPRPFRNPTRRFEYSMADLRMNVTATVWGLLRVRALLMFRLPTSLNFDESEENKSHAR